MFNSQNKKGKKHVTMSRKESALWLGRALSTSEVTLATVLKLVSIIRFQQQVIQVLFEEQRATMDELSMPKTFDELEKGESEAILQKLAEIEEQLKPVTKMVDQACSLLAKEI